MTKEFGGRVEMEEEDDKAAKVKVKNIFKKLCLPKVKLLELPKPQTAGPLNYLLVVSACHISQVIRDEALVKL